MRHRIGGVRVRVGLGLFEPLSKSACPTYVRFAEPDVRPPDTRWRRWAGPTAEGAYALLLIALAANDGVHVFLRVGCGLFGVTVLGRALTSADDQMSDAELGERLRQGR